MTSFTVYKGSKNGVTKSSVTKPEHLTGDKVLVRITASGLCGTDLHSLHDDVILGHEGVGVVEARGPESTHLRAGDRVGFGYQHDSCGCCRYCLAGSETYCADRALYGTAKVRHGSFAAYAVVREAFLHRIPDGLSDVDAAPLQCAGATVFAALQAHGTRPTETVGVIGLGGLGHLAIQFAAKMGNRVIVLSGSERKREQALALGAHEFVSTRGKDQLSVSTPIDRLLVTTSAQPDWGTVLPIMAAGAAIYPLSVASGNLEIPYLPLVLNGLAVQGSLVAPRRLHREMLAFAALHGIRPITETFPLTEEGVRTAVEKLERGDVRLRAVLTAA
ncbi:GroES-like protein [Daldinia caldariorum]|uniref:GroES-like protein n=1 Tax=Daldinia caldariorum TaxID=326644 RepID=UPI002008967F|nr:GroES-like protein [Daldinia caldariorum]KAI1471733.1 GroES-like protein [Daldinia caldariorum]